LPAAKTDSFADRILDATEQVLRRHGADKANVVDVARVLGMSHGNVYRHFPSKKALLEAVAVRFACAMAAPLEAIVRDAGRPASQRLAEWAETLRAAKRRRLEADPELFRVYFDIVALAAGAVQAHVAELAGQLARIVRDGVSSGEFPPGVDPARAARALLQATSAFHHPALILRAPPADADELRTVVALLTAGLRAKS
jgi:AcrR family transcriptional regulator